MNDCNHDLEHPIHKGRAHYVCPKCGEDITLILVLIQEATEQENESFRPF